MATKNHTVDVRSPLATLSFPRIFADTAGTKDNGKTVYDIQIIIPKSDREGVKRLLRAIKEVGVAKWGDNWTSVRNPLRDGDKEQKDLTDDGSTKGEKYPERLGCYFMSVRSERQPVVVAADRSAITDSREVYGGCKGHVSISFYPYSTSGNHGIGASLNGVQKIADGEAFGGGAPSVESMFDVLEDESVDSDGLDDINLDDDEDETPEPPKAKKSKKAKKAKDSDVDLLDELDDEDA